MPPVAKYAQRIGRLPAVLEYLADHPDGLPLITLAEHFEIQPAELREDLLAYYTADVGTLLLGLSRPDVLEFLGPDGEDVDPHHAELVRVTDERPTEELGVEYVDPSELALVYAAAQSLLELEPENAALGSAVEALTETMYGTAEPAAPSPAWNEPLPHFRRAIAEHLKVDIVYSRAWLEGVTERTIEPYRLAQTRRGWEVDAGPPDADGKLRTFLLPNIRSLEVGDEEFSPPNELESRLAAQRATETVRVQIPHAALWAADFFAEEVRVIDDPPEGATLELDLLPPVDQRVGLLLLAAGEEARVYMPSSLLAAGPTLATELLGHHKDVVR